MMPKFDAVFTSLVYAIDTESRSTILKHLENATLSPSQTQVLNDYLSNVKGRKFDYSFNPELLTEEIVKETYDLFINSKYFDESQLYGLQLLYWLQHAKNDMTLESIASWVGRVKEKYQDKLVELHHTTVAEVKFKPIWYFFTLHYLRDFKTATKTCSIFEKEDLVKGCLEIAKEFLPNSVLVYWEQQIKEDKAKKFQEMAPEDDDFHLFTV